MAGRKGFTLVELLVCLALCAVLLALIIPLVARVRQVAMNTVCTSRLRDLVTASTLYRTDHHDYPVLGQRAPAGGDVDGGPGDATGLPGGPGDVLPMLVDLALPQHVDASLLNAMCRYLQVPTIDASLAASSLPPMLQCPMVEDAEAARDDLLSFGEGAPSFYTGYAYFGSVDTTAATTTLLSRVGLRVDVLRPGRAASRRSATAGVLWADDVHWTMNGGGAWSYAHRAHPVRPGPISLSVDSPGGLAGQHRAYSDGRVEWVPAGEVGLDDRPEERERNASLRIDPLYYYWY